MATARFAALIMGFLFLVHGASTDQPTPVSATHDLAPDAAISPAERLERRRGEMLDQVRLQRELAHQQLLERDPEHAALYRDKIDAMERLTARRGAAE